MKSVSAAFVAAWLSPEKVARRRILLYRRYFDHDVNAFALAASYELDQDAVKSFGSAAWKLDTETFNVFKAANVVVGVKNQENFWSEFNENGIWAKDSVAKAGYVPYLSKMKIQFSYRLADGTFEWVDIFTGFIGDDVIGDTDNSTAQVPIIDGQIIFSQGDAENVSTTNAETAMTGTVNGLNKVFFSTVKGVGRIRVFLSGVEQEIGTDITVENLDDVDNFVEVTFAVAPPLLSTVTDIADQWHTDKKIEELVGLICDEVGILPADRTIDNIVFPSGAVTTRRFETQADFDAGTFTNTESKPDLGGFVQVSLIPTYVDQENAAAAAGSLSNNGRAVAQSFRCTAEEFITVCEITGEAGGAAVFNHTGSIRADAEGEPGDVLATFFFQTTSVAHGAKSLVLSNPVQVVAGQTLWIYLNEQASVAASFLWDRSGDDYAEGTAWRSDGGAQAYDFLFAAKARTYFTTGTRRWRSPTVDGGASLKAWGRVKIGAQVPVGLSLTVTTETSADGSAWDPETDLPANGQVQSESKRFFRMNFDFTASNVVTPKLDTILLDFTTTDITIALANFSGMSCLDAISELAKFASSEYGFTASGSFFFRNRVLNPLPSIDLDQDNAISKILNASSGIANIRNNIQVSYGSFSVKITPETQGERTPNSLDQYGSRILSIGAGSQLLIGADVNVATGAGLLYFSLLKDPRRAMRVSGKLVPQLELGDAARFTFLDAQPRPTWFWNDNTRNWGETDIVFYGERQQFVFNLVAKVIGITYNLDNLTQETEIEEIF